MPGKRGLNDQTYANRPNRHYCLWCLNIPVIAKNTRNSAFVLLSGVHYFVGSLICSLKYDHARYNIHWPLPYPEPIRIYPHLHIYQRQDLTWINEVNAFRPDYSPSATLLTNSSVSPSPNHPLPQPNDLNLSLPVPLFRAPLQRFTVTPNYSLHSTTNHWHYTGLHRQQQTVNFTAINKILLSATAPKPPI